MSSLELFDVCYILCVSLEYPLIDELFISSDS